MTSEREQVRARAAASHESAVRPPVAVSLQRLLPTGRALLVGFGLLALAGAAYAVARYTPAFALRKVEVVGAPPPVARRVQAALGPLVGRTLVSIGATDVERRLANLPAVASWSFDRDFPSTLVVRVRPEQPLAILRQRADGWVVSTTGRVLTAAPARSHSALPRLWAPPDVDVRVGGRVGGELLGGVRALAPLARTRLLHQIATVRNGQGELTLVLRSGGELRLGTPDALRVKLAVARRILPGLDMRPPLYLDVSLPRWPVTGRLRYEPRVEP